MATRWRSDYLAMRKGLRSDGKTMVAQLCSDCDAIEQRLRGGKCEAIVQRWQSDGEAMAKRLCSDEKGIM
jgi:hypothetical protein